MLVFGRLYVDHEMAVLNGRGKPSSIGTLTHSNDTGLYGLSVCAYAVDDAVGTT